MKLGFIGLGRMGYNMTLNILSRGHVVVAYNRSPGPVDRIKEKEGIIPAYTIEELVANLEPPRVVWLMVPAGQAVTDMLAKLVPLLSNGDIVIDGGNSKYTDSIQRAHGLKQKGIDFLDIGTSGGLAGARNGACMMVGGEKSVFEKVEPLLQDMCVGNGYGYCGKSGAGHYVKMVHNGIEYGMMQAIGEGFELLDKSEFDLDNAKVAKIWANGSVIRSWLIDLVQEAFEKEPGLISFQGPVKDSGECRWAVETGINLGVPTPAISAALYERFRSQDINSMTDRAISAMREGFGRHISGAKT
ncbi:phosphogluconate dehydrogenase (NAD(+)-dependent, decarboxylating) [Candidatus Margulisiibacteriota bacterium]